MITKGKWYRNAAGVAFYCVKGGARVELRSDYKENGSYMRTVTAPNSPKYTEIPAPSYAPCVDVWSVRGVTRFMGHEGPCSQATLLLNGCKVGTISDDQWGGPMSVDILGRATHEKFTADAKEFARRYRQDTFEPEGYLGGYLMDGKVDGMSPEIYTAIYWKSLVG